ncbi:MAG TPA: acyl-ACP thioesterase domain-containing protein [Anaeromyxobacteraceae bacterium]|nr:acyl-ACP thioesterase domain-containing protein [Anaeromyxobacteraceae bacterium]
MIRHLSPRTVDPRDLDGEGELPLPALAGALESVAAEHAAALGCGMDRLLARGLGWVMMRQRLEALAPLFAGDALEIATWPSGVERLVVSREFEVARAGEVVARASTAWLVLDLAARRPVRPAAVLDASLRERLPALAPMAERLPEPGPSATAARLEVRPGDIDANAHVNNGAYLRWALDATPPGVRRARRASAVEAHYLAEAVLGDVVLVRSGAAGDGLAHETVREADGKVLARLATAWAPRQGASPLRP